MINICVWSPTYLEIENDKYEIREREDLVNVIKKVLDKAYYSGERICLEHVEIINGVNYFTETERWPSKDGKKI